MAETEQKNSSIDADSVDNVENIGTAGTAVTAKTPWAPYTGGIPLSLTYFEGTMYEMVRSAAARYPENIAFDFMGRGTTYREMMREIEKCARALRAAGVGENDRVTIALPNCPQAIYMLYAVNLAGAVANMIHPLSAEKEIEFYLNASRSRVAVTLDQFYGKFAAIKQGTDLRTLIIASIRDELALPVRLGYDLTAGRKVPKLPPDAQVIRWKDFMKTGNADGSAAVSDNSDNSGVNGIKPHNFPKHGDNDPAVILYSGGTTGTTKGIVLTNRNFNALSQQVCAANPMFDPGDRMLAAMPIFHGFGLGVCIHSMLYGAGRCILVPRFTAKSYAKLITKYRCNFIAGVPTLYEALTRVPDMKNA
ncbi:MAG: AMP-binding protein, partial [Clostridia bacterium]|nr:AMP-binding protein [Clostridia bacterium]